VLNENRSNVRNEYKQADDFFHKNNDKPTHDINDTTNMFE